MKKVTFTILSILISFLVLSQETTKRELNKFDQLTVTGNFQVEIEQSDRNEVEIMVHSDEVDLDKLSFTYKNNMLTIKYQGSFVSDVSLQLVIYYSSPILLIDARRGVQIRMKNAGEYDKAVSYNADSGSKIKIDNITAPIIEAKLSKGGSIRISGSTPIFNSSVKAGGTIGAKDLKADEVNAQVLAGGDIFCAPIKTLDAKITSGGTISYKGDPKVVEKVSLGGTIKKL